MSFLMNDSETVLLLVTILIITILFGGAALYAYFKMDDTN
jgi:hypothetical protein